MSFRGRSSVSSRRRSTSWARRRERLLVELANQPRPGGTQGADLAQIALTLRAGLAGVPAVGAAAATSFPEAGVAVMTAQISSTGSYVAATFPVQRPGDP